MNGEIIFLEVLLAVAFYNIAVICLMQVEIFPSWQLLDFKTFQKVRGAHWNTLPWLVFISVGISLAGAIALMWYHPKGTPKWMLWAGLALQILAHGLTAAFWGRWQGIIHWENLGPNDPLVTHMIETHWIRTSLVTLYGILLLCMTLVVVLK